MPLPEGFRPMKACNAPENLNSLDYSHLYIQPKYDGLRAIIWEGVVYSNQLKPLPNKDLQARFGWMMGVDCEITIGAPTDSDHFNRVTSAVMTEEGDHEFYLQIHDFFIPGAAFWSRWEMCCGFVNGGERSCGLTPTTLVRNAEELQDCHHFNLRTGAEGSMLRDGRMHYKYGKSTVSEQALLKIKPFIDGEALIIGFQEAQANDNEAIINELGLLKRSHHAANKRGLDTLGSILVRDVKSGVRFAIGTGFDAKLRKEIWENMRSHLGRIVRYKHQEYGALNLPRSPVFTGFRALMDMGLED